VYILDLSVARKKASVVGTLVSCMCTFD